VIRWNGAVAPRISSISGFIADTTICDMRSSENPF
jgi:hypothetical protein